MAKQSISLINVAYVKDDADIPIAKKNHDKIDGGEAKSKDLGTGTSMPGTGTPMHGGSGIPLFEQRSEYPEELESGNPRESDLRIYSKVQSGHTAVHIHQPSSAVQVTYATKPKSYYEYAVCTVCCFFPFGILSLINASKVDLAFSQGDNDEARKRSTAAKCWALAAIVTGVAIAFITVLAITLTP